MARLRFPGELPPFTTLPNYILQDNELSFKARGLLCYLLSKPEGWKISSYRISSETRMDGRDSILSGLKELEKAGYLQNSRERNEKGQFENTWNVYHYRNNQPPETDYPTSGNPTENISTENGFSVSGKGSFKEKKDVEKKDPPIFPQGKVEFKLEPPPEAPTDKKLELQAQANHILQHLNTLTHKRYLKRDKILSRLEDGTTFRDCLLVVDWWAKVYVVENERMLNYFDNVTPFRASKFDTYRAKAEAWDAAGRPTQPDGSANHSGVVI